MFYDNVFASSYKWYSKFKKEAPLFSAVCVVMVCQMTLFFLLLGVLKKFNVVNAFNLLSNKYYLLPILLAWLVLLFKYYSKQRVEQIIRSFENKSMQERKIWGIVSIISFVVPVIALAFLLKK